MNLEDIAKKAGVSRSTVSRVINNEGYVSEVTRSRVLKVIEEEDFTPNPVARALVTQRNQIVGVVIPDSLQAVLAADNPYYYSSLLQGAVDIAHMRDYATLLWVDHSTKDEQRYYQRILRNRMMDGLLIAASLTSENLLLSSLLRNKTPFVMIGRPLQAETDISYVSVDNVYAAQQAVQHLLGLGRRRIGIITGRSDNVDSQDRLLGYQQALQMMGITPEPERIVEGRFSREGGYQCMKHLLKRNNVDAVFAASDLMAVGAQQAIQEAGLRVPEDIALVGFDDLPLATQVKPALTSIRQPISQKAAQAMSILVDLIEGRVVGPVQVLLPTQLVIRESCGFM